MRWVLIRLPVCPNHVTAQGHNERCNITVADAGRISAVGNFSTENGYDYLTIDGQSYGGRTGPSEVLLQPGAVITWYSDGSVGRDGWTICLTAVTTTSPVESTTISPTATFVPTSAPTRVPSAPPTVDTSLTVTSGLEYCHQVTVGGNPNCVTDGEGETVRSRPFCGMLWSQCFCSARSHRRVRAARTQLCLLIGGQRCVGC